MRSDSRKAFEDWFEADSFPLEHSNWFKLDEDGDYELSYVDESWHSWKAAVEWMEKNEK